MALLRHGGGGGAEGGGHPGMVCSDPVRRTTQYPPCFHTLAPQACVEHLPHARWTSLLSHTIQRDLVGDIGGEGTDMQRPEKGLRSHMRETIEWEGGGRETQIQRWVRPHKAWLCAECMKTSLRPYYFQENSKIGKTALNQRPL